MARKFNIERLPPELYSEVVNCIRAHRHMTIEDIVLAVNKGGLIHTSRSSLHRFLAKLDAKDAICASQEELTIITIVERKTGVVRTVKSSASGLAIELMISQIVPDSIVS